MTTTSGVSWTHEKIQANGIQFHYVTEGDGPLMLLLHGFPECWYSWRHQISEFSKTYKVVAIDMRGYGQTDRPKGKENYTIDILVDDVKALVSALGYKTCVLVGHDWGAIVAWYAAMDSEHSSESSTESSAEPYVEKLIIMNVPHPKCYMENLNLSQVLKSGYIWMFQLPKLPEHYLRAKDFKWITDQFANAVNPEAFSAYDLKIYKENAAQPGALTAMINYYRNLPAEMMKKDVTPIIQIPTLMLWGENDPYTSIKATRGTAKYVKNLDLKFLPNCSHWTQQDCPKEVNQTMHDFLRHKKTR